MIDHFKFDTVTLRTTTNQAVDVPALVYGPFALCNCIGGELALCHVPSGRRIRRITNLTEGAKIVAILNGLDVDWWAVDSEWEIESKSIDAIYPKVAQAYYVARNAFVQDKR